MKILKKLLKARVIVWAAVTVLLVTTLVVANTVAVNRFAPTLDSLFGGKKPITADGETEIDFGQEYDKKDEARAQGDKLTKEICEEGMVLLKNDGALPLTKKAGKDKINVSVFGKNSVNLVYGGSGSAQPGKETVKKTLFESLTAAGIGYNEELKAFYENDSLSGSGRSSNPKMDSGVSTLKIGETDTDRFTDAVKNSYDNYGDAALVVFSRIAGETWDLPRTQDEEKDSATGNNGGVKDDPVNNHYLKLNNFEKKLLKHIADSNKFDHIIILVNGSNYIDLGFLKDPQYKIDGAIVIGSPGAEGIMALGEILTGLKDGKKFSPSGHTVDTIYTNYASDPTWANFGGNLPNEEDLGDRGTEGDQYLTTKSNGKLTGTDFFLVEYEENIYQGYRYYETAGHVLGEDWYNEHVLFPFGFGLTYSDEYFTEEIVNSASLTSSLNATETFDVEIKVTNNGGEYPAKRVVQLYAEAPFDQTKGVDQQIEKPYKVLVGFAKTKELANGEHDTVKITVNPYDFASFDNRDLNGNGFKGWELDAGDYVFHVGTDAHHDIGTFTKNLAANYQWANDPKTNNPVVPLFDDVTEHMHTANMQSLSRADFEHTMPQPILDSERTLTTEQVRDMKSTNVTYDYADKNYQMPTTGFTPEEGLIQLKQLFGKPYNDELWDKFLDQMTFKEMLDLFNFGCYSTKDILRLGIPKTYSVDGPTGIVNFLGRILDVGQQPPVYGCCYYCSECLVAQTYNLKLAEEQGRIVGNEAIIGNERGDGLSYPGWYAPAVNIHRSPFSGRNTEYYSEDSFLNGKFAAEVIKSVQKKGVYVNLKHFALNDQETHRDAKGIATWVDEQAMRENYLRAFEIAVKEADPHGLMTSFNRIGKIWAGASYNLCTKVLREEWGFVGSIICDYKTEASSYMDSKQMLYAGGDLSLCSDTSIMLSSVSESNPVDVTLLRRAAHNNLYALANSCAIKVDIIGYKTATWRVVLAGVEWGIVGLLLVWGFFMIFTALRAKPKAAKAKKGQVSEEVEEAAPEEKTE